MLKVNVILDSIVQRYYKPNTIINQTNSKSNTTLTYAYSVVCMCVLMFVFDPVSFLDFYPKQVNCSVISQDTAI